MARPRQVKCWLYAASLVALVALAASSCSKSTPPAHAFQVQSRADLIGGKRALGEVGDFKVSNGLIQAVIQNVGTSRGFGAFGGSLIDVDLVRANGTSPTQGPVGNDYFTEMFPAFFLTAIEPSKVEVLNDGSDGAAAVIRVSGQEGNFITVAKSLTDVVNPSGKINYSCDYILEPGKQYLKIVVSVSNPGPTDAAWALTVPFGFVTLLGEGQRLFVPGGAGFDMRFHLEDTVYSARPRSTRYPAKSPRCGRRRATAASYALVAARPLDGNYLENKPMYYPKAKPDSLLIPVASSSFLGSFWAKAPKLLSPGTTMTYTGYLAVGTGDVASVQKVIYELKDTITRPNGKEFVQRDKVPYGTLSGVVRETPTQLPLKDVSVVLQDQDGNYVSQALTLANGRWTAPVPPGKYRAYAVDKTRSVVRSTELVEVAADASVDVNLTLEQPGLVQVAVRDELGRPLPSKVSIEGVYDNAVAGGLPRSFLYNLKVGERYRQSDLTPDDPANPDTRRYLERVLLAPHGATSTTLRPGKYTVYASRGLEYDLPSQVIEVKAGQTANVALTVTHVFQTPGWVSADFHVHSANSVDSDMGLRDRVTSFAAEGVDFMASTDHNYVTDFQPTIDALQLNDWVRSTVGIELTSLEMGHFNAFPVQVLPGPVGHGSFRWFYRPPGELFAQLRGLGKDSSKTVVQINHPRDTILGYLNAFNYGTYTGFPTDPVGSFGLDMTPQADGSLSPYDIRNYSGDFDAMEVFNGKRQELVKSYRVPAVPPEGDEPKLPKCTAGLPTLTQDCLPAPGEIVERVAKYTVNGVQKTTLQPAFPGAQDDWFTMLAQGKKVTATGNSDSHGPTAEAGLPRSYLEVGPTADGSLRALDEAATTDAMRAGRVLVTNGPFVDVTVNGQGLGRTVVAPDGAISVRIKVLAAPWVDVKSVVVRRGGRDQQRTPDTLETIPVTVRDGVQRLDVTRAYTGIPDDSFIVVEAFGDEPMWPVFTPHEIPSLQISDAISVIADAFGFGATFGKYRPDPSQQVRPYAFTNPVWVRRTVQQGLTVSKPVLPLSSSSEFKPRVMPDLMKLFHAFHSDPASE